MNRHGCGVVLQKRHRAVLANTVAQVPGKGVGQKLVAALEAEHLALEHRQPAHLHNRLLPDAVQGRDIALGRWLFFGGEARTAAKTACGFGSALARQPVAHQNVIQIVQSNPEGLVLVFELRRHGAEEQAGHLCPAMLLHEGHLALVEAKLALGFRIGQLRLSAPFAPDVAVHVAAAGISQEGQVKLRHPFAIIHIAGVGELLGPHVRVQPVGQRIMNGLHMTSGAP